MHSRHIAFLGLTLAAGTYVGGAQATVVFYPDFTNAAGITLVGSANNSADPGQLQITPSALNQSGAAYSTTPATLGTGGTFSSQFQFQFNRTGGVNPADGITFVLAANPTGLGSPGGAIGYGGVGNSVAIEFDTYNNGGFDGNSSNHVALDLNGNIANGSPLSELALTNAYGIGSCSFSSGHSQPGCMSNGDVWTATVTYDGTNLNVGLLDPAMGTAFAAINNYPINIGSFLGTNTAFFGFTAGTGSGLESQDILNWEFSNTSTLPPVSVSEPEPTALLAAGLLGLGLIRRRGSPGADRAKAIGAAVK